MKKISLITLTTVCLLVAQILHAQQMLDTSSGKPLPGKGLFVTAGGLTMKFSGFVRSDVFYDSRQIIGAGENLVSLYPKYVQAGADGKDINAASSLHMLSILSRLTYEFYGPNVLGAKSYGLIEGEFFGSTEAGINEFRLRHGLIKLDWGTTQLYIGQYWHPFVTLDCIPNVVSYGTGSPFMPLNRNPQIRVAHQIGKLNLMFTALEQRDFTGGNTAYRNSAIPQLNFHAQLKFDDFVFGASAEYENLRPAISSGTPAVASNEREQAYSALAYAKVRTKLVNISAEAVYGQDAASYVMLGGYVGYTPTDGGVDRYKPMRTKSTWIDFQFNTKTIQPGLFLGYVKNDGVKNPYDGKATTYGVTSGWGAVSASGQTVNYMFRIVPRIDYIPSNFLKFRFELDRSTAQWGVAGTDARAHSGYNKPTNYRAQFATIFYF